MEGREEKQMEQNLRSKMGLERWVRVRDKREDKPGQHCISGGVYLN